MVELDDPAWQALADADVRQVLHGAAPVLLDDWQHVPAVWDAVRRAVDRGAGPSQYLLTGSSGLITPPTHSGAGRIVSLRMRPLSLAERGVGSPTVSLRTLLSGERPQIDGGTDISLADYVREIVASGFPGLRGLSARATRAQLDGYLRRIVDRDFADQGLTLRQPAGLVRWMAAYAAATATTTSFEAIRDASTSGQESKPAKTTIQVYREILERLWVLDPVESWLATRNHLNRLSQSRKHHLADPALACRLLGLDEGALLTAAEPGPAIPRDGTLLATSGISGGCKSRSVRIFWTPWSSTPAPWRTGDRTGLPWYPPRCSGPDLMPVGPGAPGSA